MALASPRKQFRHRPGVPEDWEPKEREHRRMLAEAINDTRRGKLNNTGTVSLTPNQATTTVISVLVEDESHIVLSPLTSTAAAENWYISAKTPGQSFTVTHANAPTTDRNFTYAIIS